MLNAECPLIVAIMPQVNKTKVINSSINLHKTNLLRNRSCALTIVFQKGVTRMLKQKFTAFLSRTTKKSKQ